MSVLKVISGDYGQIIELTFVDVDTDTAANISSYTSTISMIFKSPAGVETTKTATFKTDGTDGIIRYTTETAFLTAGEWKVRGRVASGTARLTTMWHQFRVNA
jgi:hypothetical protein